MSIKELIGINGKLQSNVLKKIDTGQGLFIPASESYMRMKKDAKKDNVDIQLVGKFSGYRPCGQKGDYNEGLSKGEFTQWYAWELYKAGKGNLASNPTTSKGCTSNHGLGLAIDVKGSSAKSWIRKNGEKYGWWWGEAPTEDWHFTYDINRDTFLDEKYLKKVTKKLTKKSNSTTLKALGFSIIFLSVVGFAYTFYRLTRKK
jgi:hypothetical protein